MPVCMSVWMDACMYICMHICIYGCINGKYACMYVCMVACVHARMYECMYFVCMYIFMYVQERGQCWPRTGREKPVHRVLLSVCVGSNVATGADYTCDQGEAPVCALVL